MSSDSGAEGVLPVDCPVCGSTEWIRDEGGWFDQRHTIDTRYDPELSAAHHWDETQLSYEAPTKRWVCRRGHEASDDVEEDLRDWGVVAGELE